MHPAQFQTGLVGAPVSCRRSAGFQPAILQKPPWIVSPTAESVPYFVALLPDSLLPERTHQTPSLSRRPDRFAPPSKSPAKENTLRHRCASETQFLLP